MVFKSAVDAWFAAVMIASAVIVVVAVVPVLAFVPPLALVLVGFSLLASVGLPIWVLLTTDYRVEGPTLAIRSGPFKWKVPLSEIDSVRESRSWLSSPALSLRRLEVRYGAGKSILVSPKDREGFLRAIGQTLQPG